MKVKYWKHAGLECFVEKRLGHYCGYVEVPKDHPAHGLSYDEIDVDVHGGLTYGQVSDNGTIFGFDCAHVGDFVPSIVIFLGGKTWKKNKQKILREMTDEEAQRMADKYGEHYWTLEEVVEETNCLAEQLKEWGKEWKNTA